MKTDQPQTAINQAPLPDFESTAFRERYVTERADGLFETRLLIKGLRCAGCVHTSESLLRKIPGVHEAEVNYSNHRARFVWDPKESSLSPALESLRDAGYEALPQVIIDLNQTHQKDEEESYTRLVVAIFCSMNIMWIAIAQYAGYFSGMEQRYRDLFNLAGFVLSTPVLFFSSTPFLHGAWNALRQSSLNMDFQVALSSLLIYAYSIYAAVSRTGETYFEAVAMFITFLSVGKYLEKLATRRIAENSSFFQNLIPFSATRIIKKDTEQEIKETVSLEDVQPGWILEALPGERIATDGTVQQGTSMVDESHLTGEAMPLLKVTGSALTSGSINQDGVLRYQVTKRVTESTISRIIQLIDEALSRKPSTRMLADLLAKYFVSAVTLTALFTFLWDLLPEGSFESALIHGVAVLIIACPCALSLATPIAVLTGLSAATERKILFRSGVQFETLRSITDVVFDKTGTLTEGRPEVKNCSWFEGEYEAEALTLVRNSNHPISGAVQRYLIKTTAAVETTDQELDSFQEVAGKGLCMKIADQKTFGGSLAFMEESGVVISAEQKKQIQLLRQQRPALFFFAVCKAENTVPELSAVFSIHDPLRSESPETIQHLKAMGLEIHLLTGDHAAVANSVAAECGIVRNNVCSSVDPQGKADFIESLHKQQRAVIMVGDGINDAPALALADVGIAMGSSADKALEISDIVLLNNNPQAIVEALRISRKTYRLILQNLALSVIYNVIAIPVAIAGWVIPLVAALSMSLSSLLVVLNSLRVRFK
ncbi:MAG: cation-translocating P-type ATPase [SAR324 cluster bacterium]|nr:cation-translocating P-type ATPase [SAR324 cluster bacterium]MBL7034794.1 cation-translocating P-type ATPase [SAR324 cluster bacterium]